MNAEDNMNVLLEGVTVTGKDGKAMNLEQVGRGVGGGTAPRACSHVNCPRYCRGELVVCVHPRVY